jgi:hypothetical protein
MWQGIKTTDFMPPTLVPQTFHYPLSRAVHYPVIVRLLASRLCGRIISR